MKSIQISNQTFGALWQKAHEADQTEEDILRRLLGLSGSPPLGDALEAAIQETSEKGAQGFYDARFEVKFPQGFRIYRSYKGKNYSARASGGKWHLEGFAQPFDSLNELNVAIGAKSENAWISWFFDEAGGVKKMISDLRKPTTIKRRI